MFFYKEGDLLSKNELLSQLPPEARAAYRGTGDEWEWVPDTAETAARVEMTDSGWQEYHIERGIEIEEGALRQVYYHVELPEGDWSRFRIVPWGSDAHISAQNELFREADHAQMWRDYYKWVSVKGRDPIGKLNVDPTETVKWRACLTESSNGVVLEAARRVSPPSDKEFQYKPPLDLPKSVSEYLLLQGRGGPGASDGPMFDEVVVCPGRVESRADLQAMIDEHGTGTIREDLEREPTRFADGDRITEEEHFYLDVEISEPVPDLRLKEARRKEARQAMAAIEAKGNKVSG
jgi:hypothetical protein